MAIETITKYKVGDGTEWDSIDEAKRHDARITLRKLDVPNPSPSEIAKAVDAVLDYAASAGVPQTMTGTVHYLARSGVALPDISAQLLEGQRLVAEMEAGEDEEAGL